MSYTKQNFKSGSKLYASQLNAMDEQIRKNAENIANMPSNGGNTPVAESDPTVPEWAKQPNKPSYTAQEVGAMPSDTKIPAKTSELENDSKFATEDFVAEKVAEAQLGGNGEAPDLSGYLTETEADGKYQPKGNYMTETEADGKYQPKGNYMTETAAAGKYQPKGEYLTETAAAGKYQPKGEYLTEHQPIKTINGLSLIGEGNIIIEGGSEPEQIIVTKTAGTMIQNPTRLRGGIVDYFLVKPNFHSEIIGKKVTKVKIYKVADSTTPSNATVKLGKVTITGDFQIASQTVESCATARASMTSISTHDLSGYEVGAVAELACDITLGENEIFCFDVTGGHCVGYCDDEVSVPEIMYVYSGLVCPQSPGKDGLVQHIPISVEYEEVEYADDTTPSGCYNPLAKFAGKKVSIVGDSISTFAGYIPSGYETFYPNSTNAQAGTGSLTAVEQTWWHKLCKESGLTLLKNASWSGSWVTGDSTSNTNAMSAVSNKRIADLKGSDGSTPDIIIVYIGINDLFNSNVATRGATLGDWTPDEVIPEEGNILEFSAAYALLLKKLVTAYPAAKIFCGTLLTTGRSYKDTDGEETFPTKHNGVTLNQVNNKIREVANGIGCNVIDVHNCGINYFNIGRYTIDMTHPNADGATLIKNQMLAELIAKY